MFHISYLPLTCFMSSTSKLTRSNIAFVLRSVLGKHLRAMCCIAHREVCETCIYNKQCMYAFIFESIIEKQNPLLQGTNRTSHPFSFSHCDDGSFTITLFGKATEALPYIYAAFVRAGREGLFKERESFEIASVMANGEELIISENQIQTQVPTNTWSYPRDNTEKNEKTNTEMQGAAKPCEILVQLKSPLRFKVNGKYSLDFTAEDFMKMLYRRLRSMCLMYGTFDEGFDYTPQHTKTITNKNLNWVDDVHYSARQKSAMKLGGVVGSFKLVGTFSEFELALLDFGKIANAGKNVGFGLGEMDYWVR